MVIFLVLIILVHVFVMFKYKKRILQIRILIFLIILLIGFTGVLFYFAHAGFSEETVSFRIPMAMPVVAAILDYIAIRYIGKDEALVRSLNRIRP
jgi:glucan phosphoethanolaminetransferase (alkaline phosphatase superfamily)